MKNKLAKNKAKIFTKQLEMLIFY